jgi:hypothetical protein
MLRHPVSYGESTSDGHRAGLRSRIIQNEAIPTLIFLGVADKLTRARHVGEKVIFLSRQCEEPLQIIARVEKIHLAEDDLVDRRRIAEFGG